MDFERAAKFKQTVQLLENLGKRLRGHNEEQLASIKAGTGQRTAAEYRRGVEAMAAMLKTVNVDDVDIEEFDFLLYQDK